MMYNEYTSIYFLFLRHMCYVYSFVCWKYLTEKP